MDKSGYQHPTSLGVKANQAHVFLSQSHHLVDSSSNFLLCGRTWIACDLDMGGMELKLFRYGCWFAVSVPVLFILFLLIRPHEVHEHPLVAVIDSGIDLNHEDFIGRLEKGYDFYSWDTVPDDENGHGTHVAGIILQMEPKAKLLPIRVLQSKSKNSYSSSFGLFYAIYKQADVINMSYGSEAKDPLSRLAIWVAQKKGIIMVASVGNDGERTESLYPAKYKGVVSVGTFDQNKKVIDPSSNLGKVDFLAPGVNIESSNIEGKDSEKTGSSMAAAYVTGMVASMLGVEPTLNREKVMNELQRSSVSIVHDKKTYFVVDEQKMKAAKSETPYVWIGSYEKVTRKSVAKVPVSFTNIRSVSTRKNGETLQTPQDTKKNVLTFDQLEEGPNTFSLIITPKTGKTYINTITIIKDTMFPEIDVKRTVIRHESFYVVTVLDWSAESAKAGQQTIVFELDDRFEKSPFLIKEQGDETEVTIKDRSNFEKKFVITKK